MVYSDLICARLQHVEDIVWGDLICARLQHVEDIVWGDPDLC